MNHLAELEEHIRSHAGRGLYSPESELALIGAALSAPADCEEVFEVVPGAAFGSAVVGRIWDICRSIIRTGGVPTPPIVADRIGSDADFAAWGGVDRLADLVEVGSTAGVVDHAAAVSDRAQRRALSALAQTVSAKAADTSTGTAEALLAEMERGAAEIARNGPRRDAWITVGDLVTLALDQAEARSGRVEFPTGLSELDEVLGGYHAGDFTILGGRTGMAKTTALGFSALANARAGVGTCVFSLEMAEEPMGLRIACDVAYNRGAVVYSAEPLAGNPTVTGAMQNRLGQDQRVRLRAAAAEVRNLPLVFDHRPGLTMAEIEASVRRLHRRWEKQGIRPGPVFIDHLGKVRPQKDRRGDRRIETADASNDCFEMAKRLGVPVVAAAQLNRDVEKRGSDKRPQLSDLREAGQLEEDARQVVLLYRPAYYYRPPEDPSSETTEERFERERKLENVRHKLFWIVAKNSHGPACQVESFCDIASSAIRGRNPHG